MKSSISLAVGALRAVAPSGAPHFAPNTASDQFAKNIPGFGGAFVAGDTLNVYLTSNANTVQGQATARAAISSLFAAGRRPEMPIKFLLAKHSFIQLRMWEGALKNHFQRSGVRTAQVDERANGFKISLSSSAAEQALRAQLAALGIPTEIVASQSGGPPVVPLGWAFMRCSTIWDLRTTTDVHSRSGHWEVRRPVLARPASEYHAHSLLFGS